MYFMNNKEEFLRLEEQNSNDLYSVKSELDEIAIESGSKVLDVGVGSGAVLKELCSKSSELQLFGIDISEIRIAQTKKDFLKKGIHANLQVSTLYELPFEDEFFDVITCRFVFHHIDEHKRALSELYRVCKKGGKVILIDSDGIFFNYYSKDNFVLEKMKLLQKDFPGDMFAGRKLKSLILDRFAVAKSRIQNMHFQGNDLSLEKEQYEQRLKSYQVLINKILGEEDGKEFISRFLKSLESDATELFYNKFIVQGIK